jgi:hypothetical protein
VIYEVTLETEYYNQICINRWNYRMTGTPAAVLGGFALLSAMGWTAPNVAGNFPDTSLAWGIQALVSDQVKFRMVVARALYSVTDFYEVPFVGGIVGKDAGQAMSPAIAWGFYTSRTRTDVRRATKRFPGVAEAVVDSGGVVAAAQMAELNAVAAKMSATLTYTDEGNTLSFAPVVCGKERYNVDTKLADPEGTAYRYYRTLTEQNAHTADSIIWQPYSTVRTQVSRQYGKGR